MSDRLELRTIPAVAAETFKITTEFGIDVGRCKSLAEVMSMTAEVIATRAKASKSALRQIEALELELAQIMGAMVRDDGGNTSTQTPVRNGGDGAH